MNRADRRKTAKTNKERIDEYILAGQQLMNAGGDMRDAQRLFRQVLALDPGDPQANLHLGVVEMWGRNYQKAQEYFARALESDPNSAQIMNNLGLSLHEQGAIAEAINLYERAIQVDPANVEAHVNLARGMLHVNQRDRALSEARQAATMRPDLGSAQFILGLVCQTMGLTDEAAPALQKAVELIPGHIEANFRLARLMYEPGKEETFLDPCTKAFEANADLVDAAITYTDVLFGAGRFEEARDILLRFADREEKNLGQLGIFNGLAHAYASLGDFDQAIAYHKKAFTITVDDPNPRYFYGRTLLWKGDYKAAAEQFKKAIGRLPFHQDLIGMMMLTQKLDGNQDAAKLDAETFIKEEMLAPKDAAYPSIEALNAAIVEKLKTEATNPVHPFDSRRRMSNTVWEAALGKQDLEPIQVISENFRDLMTGYIADMPDNVQNHPLLARKQFGLGPSGSWAEAVTRTDGFDYALDQQGWFKIIYFLSVPEEVEDETKKAGWLRTGMPHFKNDFGLTPDKEIKPVSGKAVIMPAYQWHGFNALESKEPLTFITVQVNASVG